MPPLVRDLQAHRVARSPRKHPDRVPCRLVDGEGRARDCCRDGLNGAWSVHWLLEELDVEARERVDPLGRVELRPGAIRIDPDQHLGPDGVANSLKPLAIIRRPDLDLQAAEARPERPRQPQQPRRPEPQPRSSR